MGEVYYSVFCFFKANRASAKDDLLLCIFLLLGAFNGLLALVAESSLCCLLMTSLELLLYKEETISLELHFLEELHPIYIDYEE